MAEKPVMVVIPKDADVREDADYIYVRTPRQKYERRFIKGSIVLSYRAEEAWSGMDAQMFIIEGE